VRGLKSNQFRNYQLEPSQIVGLIDNGTKNTSDTVENMNVLYDKKLKKIGIYVNEKWDTYLLDNAVIKVMEYYKEILLDEYELYTIRKIYSYDTINKSYFEGNLGILYNFLAHFDLQPHVIEAELSDIDIIGRELRENNPMYLFDHYTAECVRITKTLKKGQKNEMRKNILDKILTNSSHSVDDLNKTILGIIKVDDEFKNKILFCDETKSIVAS
jgi:hypothetical protein